MMQKTIDRFQVRDRLGAGGQGTVYRCHDPRLGRTVAVKLLNRPLVPEGDPLHEARLVSRLQHPNIVTIFDVGEHQGRPYLVFEYVEGKLLSRRLAGGPLAVPEALDIIEGVLRGIDQAHGLDIVHCDLRPTNIIIGRDAVPKVMDFGIAQLGGCDHRCAQRPSDPHYMAPEAIRQGEMGPRSDVFALGVMLWEMLAGRSAFRAEEAGRALDEVLEAGLAAPSSHNPDVDPRLDALVAKAVEKEPQARYGEASEMLEALLALRRTDASDAPVSGQETVAFLLRRMGHSGDFPALSATITSLNRLVDAQDEDVSTLAATIVKDFALTSKILKIVNSAYYGRFAGQVETISRAIVILGVKAIRSIASSLVFFEHLHNKVQLEGLRDQVAAALFSAVFARRLAEAQGLAGVEEAFVCALLHPLGRILVTYYLPEERDEIDRLMAQGGLSARQAERSVLGIELHRLGTTVAKEWHFPAPIVRGMQALDEGEPRPPATEEDRRRLVAVFSNELAGLVGEGDTADLLRRFQPALELDARQFDRLLNQSIEEFLQLNRDLAGGSRCSGFVSRLRAAAGGRHSGDAGASDPDPAPGDPDRPAQTADEPETLLANGIQEVSALLLEEHSLTQVFNILLETLYRGMAPHRVVLCLQDVRARQMVAKLGFGTDIEAFMARFRFSTEARKDLFQGALADNAPLHVTDLGEPGIRTRLPAWFTDLAPDAACLLLLPLVVQGRAVGLIYADHIQVRGLEVTPERLSLLKALRNQALLALRSSLA